MPWATTASISSASAPALRSAARMARSAPAPVGSGAVMWYASQPTAPPASSQMIVAPRARACSSVSSTRIAAPSEATKPVRSRSKGRETAVGSPSAVDSAPALASEEMRYGPRMASVPPARTTSTSPRRSRCMPSTSAMAPAAQAPTPAVTGPVTPRRMAVLAAAMLADTRGT